MKDFKKISDNELDHLFRESDNNARPEFEESAWDKMESLLDDSDKLKGGFLNKKPLIYSILLLLMFSMAYLSYDNYKGKYGKLSLNEISSKGAEANKPNQTVEFNEDAKSNLTLEELELSKEKIEELSLNSERMEFASSKSLRSGQKIKGEAKFVKPKSFVNEVGNENQNIQKELGITKKLNEHLKNEIVINSNDEADLIKNKQYAPNIDVLDFQKEVDTIETDSNKADESLITSVQRLNDLELKPFNFYTAEFSLPSFEAPARVIELKNYDKWSLRLAISPDFSTIPQNTFFKIGHNWAALVEYRINNRWSFQTGVIQSLKFYNANPEQYLWPERWGSRPAELNKIDARCNMLDIPINVRYDISLGRNRWFAQTGLTSYLMLNEKYDYVYDTNYSNVTWNTWEGKTGFYGAAVANFSFGIERKIGKRLTFQAEPFFKIPLAEVGYGKVKLISTGLFISSKLVLKK